MHRDLVLLVLLVGACNFVSSDEVPSSAESVVSVPDSEAGTNDLVESVPVDPSTVVSSPDGGYTLNLGSSSIGGILFVGVNLFEPGAGRCSIPNTLGFAGRDAETGDTVAVSIPYEGDFASGGHALDRSAIVEGLDAEGGIQTHAPSMSLSLEGASYYSASGNVDVLVDPQFDEVTLTLGGVSMETLEGTPMEESGELHAPLRVTCFTLEPGDDCGWLPDAVPYSSAFCVEAAASFPESVRY